MPVVGAEPATRKSFIVKSVTGPLTTWEMQESEKLGDQAAQTRHQREMIINIH